MVRDSLLSLAPERRELEQVTSDRLRISPALTLLAWFSGGPRSLALTPSSPTSNRLRIRLLHSLFTDLPHFLIRSVSKWLSTVQLTCNACTPEMYTRIYIAFYKSVGVFQTDANNKPGQQLTSYNIPEQMISLLTKKSTCVVWIQEKMKCSTILSICWSHLIFMVPTRN